jgi:hypothetical protein
MGQSSIKPRRIAEQDIEQEGDQQGQGERRSAISAVENGE